MWSLWSECRRKHNTCNKQYSDKQDNVFGCTRRLRSLRRTQLILSQHNRAWNRDEQCHHHTHRRDAHESDSPTNLRAYPRELSCEILIHALTLHRVHPKGQAESPLRYPRMLFGVIIERHKSILNPNFTLLNPIKHRFTNIVWDLYWWLGSRCNLLTARRMIEF